MLRTSSLIGFVATARAEESRHFYQEVLGLSLVEDTPFALVFNCNSVSLRVQKVQSVVPAGHTVLGWAVSDINREVRQLASKGVVFQRFEGLGQDEQGVWKSPGGAKVAWFQDPDGNTLSLTQQGEA